MGDDYDYLVEMYGERIAERLQAARSYGATIRECCETDTAMWHTRPCTVNGPEGPPLEPPKDPSWGSETDIGYPPPDKSYEFADNDRVTIVENDKIARNYGVMMYNPEPYVLVEQMRERHHERQTVWAKDMRLTSYRGCCPTLVGSGPHAAHCMSHYFADGQTVVRSRDDFVLGPGRAFRVDPRYHIQEERAATDRTFENESRLNPRKARKPRPYDKEYLF